MFSGRHLGEHVPCGTCLGAIGGAAVIVLVSTVAAAASLARPSRKAALVIDLIEFVKEYLRGGGDQLFLVLLIRKTLNILLAVQYDRCMY